ncbi:MAG: PIN domain-containing protein [Parvularculaceae bacterium]
MISTFTAFFDSNVFVGARLRSLIVELAQSGQFRARWSEDVHREWMNAVISNRPDLTNQALSRVKDQMDKAVPDCVVDGYQSLIGCLHLPDRDDRHVLAAALVARASVIVTFNEKDFPAKTLAPLGLHTRHPDDFILDIASLDRALFDEHVAFDISHYSKPPLSVADYCAALRKAGVPKSAARIEEIPDLFPAPPAP